jgi:hypothetical protein
MKSYLHRFEFSRPAAEEETFLPFWIKGRKVLPLVAPTGLRAVNRRLGNGGSHPDEILELQDRFANASR